MANLLAGRGVRYTSATWAQVRWMDIDQTSVQQWDRQYVWNPFTQHAARNARETVVFAVGPKDGQ